MPAEIRLPSTSKLSISEAMLRKSCITLPIKIGAMLASITFFAWIALKIGSRPPTPEY